MIRYALHCDGDHTFEAWFGGSADFDEQIGRNLVSCPVCGSTAVSKALMAPALTGAARERLPVAAPSPGSASQHPVARPDPKMAELVEAMRRLKQHIKQHADYVGPDFAEEARRIHYGETEERGIYGETTAEEAKRLVEEGIEVHPLPVLPEETN